MSKRSGRLSKHSGQAKPNKPSARLQRLVIPSVVAELPIPSETRCWISDARGRIETFQDRWQKHKIEQFVAADYELVYQSLRYLLQVQSFNWPPLVGRRFLEWGSGFAVVTALASSLGMDAIGIESEPTLFAQGQQTLADWHVAAELIHGNFLPHGADRLADDPTLPSLGHDERNAYDTLELDLDDFAIIYAYPWPGEDDFLEAVFAHYAADGAYLMMFCGPNDVRLLRRVVG